MPAVDDCFPVARLSLSTFEFRKLVFCRRANQLDIEVLLSGGKLSNF